MFAASAGVSAAADRVAEREEIMAHRRLTLEQQLVGVRAALRSRKTPKQLREGLGKRQAQLEALLRRQAARRETAR